MAQVPKHLCLGCSASSFDAYVILSVLPCTGIESLPFFQCVEVGSPQNKIILLNLEWAILIQARACKYTKIII